MQEQEKVPAHYEILPAKIGRVDELKNTAIAHHDGGHEQAVYVFIVLSHLQRTFLTKWEL